MSTFTGVNAFDKVSRFLSKMEPHRFIACLLAIDAERFGLRGWMDTRLIANFQNADRTCDAVPEFETGASETMTPELIMEFQCCPVWKKPERAMDYGPPWQNEAVVGRPADPSGAWEHSQLRTRPEKTG